MSDDALVERLREVAYPYDYSNDPYGGFTPEQVARGLEAALNKAGDLTAGAVSLAWAHGVKLPEDANEQCIAAFLAACKEG